MPARERIRGRLSVVDELEVEPLNIHVLLRRKVARNAISVWIACALAVGIFAFLGFRTMRVAPAWWLLTTCLILYLAGRLLSTACASGRESGNKLWNVGVSLVGTTPIVFWVTLIVCLSITARVRASIDVTPMIRLAACWITSCAEVEAWCRYPRWITGDRVELVDDGYPEDASDLVLRMDQHVEKMSRELGAEPPAVRSVWVRGSVLGQQGRAIVTLAICEPPAVGNDSDKQMA